jgi:hypothetical protein
MLLPGGKRARRGVCYGERGCLFFKTRRKKACKEEGMVRGGGMLVFLTGLCLPVGLRAEPREALTIDEGFCGIETCYAYVET